MCILIRVLRWRQMRHATLAIINNARVYMYKIYFRVRNVFFSNYKDSSRLWKQTPIHDTSCKISIKMWQPILIGQPVVCAEERNTFYLILLSILRRMCKFDSRTIRYASVLRITVILLRKKNTIFFELYECVDAIDVHEIHIMNNMSTDPLNIN